MNSVQRQRLFWRIAFFVLFVLAPPLDLLRLDLNAGHFVFLGMPWTLGVRDVGSLQASINIILRVFVPLFLVVGGIGVFLLFGVLAHEDADGYCDAILAYLSS